MKYHYVVRYTIDGNTQNLNIYSSSTTAEVLIALANSEKIDISKCTSVYVKIYPPVIDFGDLKKI